MSDYSVEIQGEVKRGRTWLTVSGVLFVISGILAIVFPLASTWAMTSFVGIILLMSGVANLFNSFSLTGTGPFFGALLLSLLTLATGLFLLFNPLAGAVTLTLILAFILMFSGTNEIISAFDIRPAPGWVWLLLSAAVSMIAGMMIIVGLPGPSLIILGLILGFKFVSAGLAQLMLVWATKD
jgi:uncharacterized membrane protein HdeD (DUF308 family)